MLAARWRSRPRRTAAIPTATMADIAFLLLIFFLTSTIFRLESGLQVALPRAETGIMSARPELTHIWVDRAGAVAVDGARVDPGEIEGIVARRIGASSRVVVSLQIDEQVPYEIVDRVMTELKRANARNVSLGIRNAGTPD